MCVTGIRPITLKIVQIWIPEIITIFCPEIGEVWIYNAVMHL